MPTTPSTAYEGDWMYDTSGERELLTLWDANDDTFLRLKGTERFCVKQGDSYDKMRTVLRRNGKDGQKIHWWVTNSCSDGYVRICVENSKSERACSTYINEGWFKEPS